LNRHLAYCFVTENVHNLFLLNYITTQRTEIVLRAACQIRVTVDDSGGNSRESYFLLHLYSS